MDGRTNSLMDRKVVGVVLCGLVAMVAVVTSLTTPQLLGVVWCGAVVAVVAVVVVEVSLKL